MEARQRTWMVPVMTQETHPQTCTVYHSVPEVVTRQVVCCHKVPVYDCCGCQVGCRNEEEVRNVSCTVMRCVPETITRNVTVNVCHYEQKSETVQVPVTTSHMEERSQKVMETVCVPTPRKFTVQVAVPKQVTEEFKVQVCSMAEKVEKFKVQVVEYKTEAKTRTVPVTTWKCVAQQVTENVPVCVAVQVPVRAGPGRRNGRLRAVHVGRLRYGLRGRAPSPPRLLVSCSFACRTGPTGLMSPVGPVLRSASPLSGKPPSPSPRSARSGTSTFRCVR